MEFTFGIITDGNSDNFITRIINSIIIQNIPNYEIIIVGKTSIASTSLIKIIPFDESVKNGWITLKKNLICHQATYENIVLLHDYIILDTNWYSGFLQYGNNFKFCITQIKTIDGKRFRDFIIYRWGLQPYFQDRCLLPYSYKPANAIRQLLYISGTYYIIKKDVMITHLLNENLTHGDGEDVEISQRLATNNIYIECNSYSSVSLLKDKSQSYWEKDELTNEDINIIESLSNDTLDTMFNTQKSHVHQWIYDRCKVII